MTQHKDGDYPVRVTIPIRLYNSLMEAIGTRAMRLVRENNPAPKRAASQAEDFRVTRQARQEALEEAMQDWLAKPKDEKWL